MTKEDSQFCTSDFKAALNWFRTEIDARRMVDAKPPKIAAIRVEAKAIKLAAKSNKPS